MLNKAVGPLLVAPLLLIPSAPAAAQTVDEVLTEHFKAIGGLESWKNVQSMRVTGTLALSLGLEGPFTLVRSRPDKYRIEFTLQGMTGIQSTDGETSWMLMPFTGQTQAQEMPQELADSFRDQADFDGLLMGYGDAGLQIELVGKETVEDTESYKLKVTSKSGNVSHYFLDSKSYLIVRIVASQKAEGGEVTTYESLTDYKAVGDLLIAHLLEIESTATPGMTQVLTVTSVELNPELSEATFAMPGGESN